MVDRNWTPEVRARMLYNRDKSNMKRKIESWADLDEASKDIYRGAVERGEGSRDAPSAQPGPDPTHLINEIARVAIELRLLTGETVAILIDGIRHHPEPQSTTSYPTLSDVPAASLSLALEQLRDILRIEQRR